MNAYNIPCGKMRGTFFSDFRPKYYFGQGYGGILAQGWDPGGVGELRAERDGAPWQTLGITVFYKVSQ